MRRIVCFCMFLVFTEIGSATVLVSAGSWPCWRGANHDGICTETGLMQTWTEKGPPLKWKATGLGAGYSSVSIENGRIYTMGRSGGSAPSSGSSRLGRLFHRGTTSGDPGECKVVSLDARNGDLMWSNKIGVGDPIGTPTIDGDYLYALDPNGQLACLLAANGRLIWMKRLTKDFGGRIPSFGYGESPLIDGDTLLCTPGAHDAMIVALDKRSGAVLWKGEAPSKLGYKGADGAGGYSSIVVSNGGGVKQYVQLTGRGLVSFRADDGKFLWHYNAVANRTANIPTPIVKDDYVFASSGYPDGGTVLVKLKKHGDGISVQPVYFLPADRVQNSRGEMVLVKDHVYFGNGQGHGFPICVELETGKVVWKGGHGPGTGSAALLEADGELYFRYENGVMGLIEANPDKYVLKGKFEIASHNGKSWPHPVIVNRCLYVRDQDTLLCYDVARH